MKVELVSKTQGVGKYSELNSEEIVSAIARHGIIKEDNGKLVKYLLEHKHYSPLDMINFTFEIETSRAIGRQILRHSSVKPQESSERYSDRVEFETIELRKEHPTSRQSSTEGIALVSPGEFVLYNPDRDARKYLDYVDKLSEHLEVLKDLYKEGIELGLAKECVRMILPETVRTTLTLNGTLRSWLSFLNVRLEEHTQKECREIAEEILKILKMELPNVFSKLDTKNGLFM